MTQRILITGAASGLGRELALQFGRSGWQVCVADIQAQRGADVVAEIQALGQAAFYQPLDVTRSEDFTAALAQMNARFGGIDAIINNAGVASGGPFDWLDEATWRWVLDINLMGVVRGCSAVVQAFKQQNHGFIVNIASMAGLLNPPGMANYNVAKAGVISLSETLYSELAPYNISVTCVCPSFFKTNLLENTRSPDAGMLSNMERFMSHSELSAADIAGMIYAAMINKKFLVLPHEKAREAWVMKKNSPELFFQDAMKVAESIKRKAVKKD
ncbi:MAG TPA: SDR family oxidoreductase [Pseudomonadales bacterium]|nr:SDR family oxidoreductase [Pseudomonadales bacterium]